MAVFSDKSIQDKVNRDRAIAYSAFYQWILSDDAPKSIPFVEIIDGAPCPLNRCKAQTGEPCKKAKRPHPSRLEAYYEVLHQRRKAKANYSKSTLQIWQHEETGRRCWKDSSPGERWNIVQMIYEDQLPADMPKPDYDAWWAESLIVDGVRMGPAYSQL